MRPFYFWLFFSFILSSRIAYAAPFEAGMGVDVETAGFFLNPKLQKVTVVAIKAGLPAESAGVVVGDRILAINDCKIPGCPAKKAKTMTQSAPVEVTLMNSQGEVRTAVIKARAP